LLTLNQIIDQIKTLANAHYQIAEVGVGTIAELQSKPDREYPLLWLSNEGGTLDNNYKVDNIRLTMFGRVTVGDEGQDDDASELEVLSDMQLILLDFLNYFHQNHGQDYVTDKSNTLEHFTERTNDRTAGYSTVLELKQFYDWSKCKIPQSGASIPPTVDGLTLYDFCDADVIARLTSTQIACLEAELCGACADATVQINGIEVATPASGATVDIPVNLDGVPSGSWDGDSWEVTSAPCADATVQLNGVDMTDIPSGDTENIQVRQSSGSTLVGSKQGQYWRIDDSDISINGSPVADVMAEDSLDIDVTQDGSPVGSWNGSAWIIPNCSPSVTVSVTLSDDTPKLGQIITITATASGITPTSYSFLFQQLDGSFTSVVQASNTYDWTVSKYDNFNVTVVATDNVNSGVGADEGVTTGDVDADAIITAQETAIGGSMDATAQAWVLGFILRLKGIYTTLPENVFEQLSDANSELYAMFPDTSTTASVSGYSINAIDPTRNATMVGFVAGDATVNGITGGSGKYMIMNNAPSDYGQNDTSLHAYIRTASITCFIGAGDGSDIRDTSDVHSYMFGQSSDRIEADINGDERDVPIANGLQANTGFCSIQRNKSDRLIFMNDEYVTDITPNNSITPSANLYYGMAGNASGTATRNSTSSVSCLINAPYLEECALTTLAEAVIWLQTQIARNV